MLSSVLHVLALAIVCCGVGLLAGVLFGLMVGIAVALVAVGVSLRMVAHALEPDEEVIIE